MIEEIVNLRTRYNKLNKEIEAMWERMYDQLSEVDLYAATGNENDYIDIDIHLGDGSVSSVKASGVVSEGMIHVLNEGGDVEDENDYSLIEFDQLTGITEKLHFLEEWPLKYHKFWEHDYIINRDIAYAIINDEHDTITFQEEMRIKEFFDEVGHGNLIVCEVPITEFKTCQITGMASDCIKIRLRRG